MLTNHRRITLLIDHEFHFLQVALRVTQWKYLSIDGLIVLVYEFNLNFATLDLSVKFNELGNVKFLFESISAQSVSQINEGEILQASESWCRTWVNESEVKSKLGSNWDFTSHWRSQSELIW